MNCPHPLSFVNNEEIFTTALDAPQDLPKDVRLHVEQCELCQSYLLKYTRANSALLSSLYRKECPDSMTLSSYATNMLARDEQLPIQLHLRVCPLCRDEVDEVRRFFADTEGLI